MIIIETEKLYSPLEFYLHDRREEESNGEYGMYDLYDERYQVSCYDAAEHMDAIELAILRDRERMDKTRGMAEYLHGSLGTKVEALFPTIENYGDMMVCAAQISLTAPLTPEEMADLKDWWRGQLSDGWGEGFEQREIRIGHEELYIVPWNRGDDFFTDTEREFSKRLGLEPLEQKPPIPAQASLSADAEERPLTEQKLYSPVYCELMDTNNDEYGSDYESSPIPQTAAAYYVDEIHEAILKECMPDEEERGLMAYYHEADSVNDKVRSLLVDVEVHDGKLWGVATIQVAEPLTPEELDTLRDYITGQYSDGFGEGFEQRDVKVSDGELSVHLWDYDREGGFFIDTEREFRQRLGLEPSVARQAETPARTALHEPDIYDDEATAALREQLIARLDTNLASYFDDIRTNEGLYIPGMAPEIAAVTGAYYYMTEIHSFHKSELEYLLQFQNPLQVVADAFQDAGIDDHSDVMWEIFDREAALQSDYERMPTAPGTPGEAALKEELFDRLDKNLSDYSESLLGTDQRELIGMAEEIASRYAAREYMKTGYDYKTGEVEYLLQFQDPLALVADGWPGTPGTLDGPGGISDIVTDILEDRSSHGHYARVVEAASPVSKESARDASSEKMSVLEQIREAARAPKETHKDKPARERDRNGPEL